MLLTLSQGDATRCHTATLSVSLRYPMSNQLLAGVSHRRQDCQTCHAITAQNQGTVLI